MSCCLPNKKIIASVIPPVSLDATPESPASTTAMTLTNTFNMANPNMDVRATVSVIAASIEDDTVPEENNSPVCLSTIKENGDSGVRSDSLSVSSDSSAEIDNNK